MRDLMRAVAARSLAAIGLARRVDVDRERLLAAATMRETERQRAGRDAAAASAKLAALQEKLNEARERLVSERSESRFLRGLVREYRERLTRMETALAKSVAAERRLSAIFAGYDER